MKIIIEYGKDLGIDEVKEYLPKLTKQGSGDDVSVAAIIDTDLLNENKEVIELQMQLYKKSCALEERKHTLESTKEKADALRRRIVSFAKPGTKPGSNKKRLSETAHEIEDLEEKQTDIESEINELSEDLESLSQQLQDLQFDREVASFTGEKIVNDVEEPLTEDANDSKG